MAYFLYAFFILLFNIYIEKILVTNSDKVFITDVDGCVFYSQGMEGYRSFVRFAFQLGIAISLCSLRSQKSMHEFLGEIDSLYPRNRDESRIPSMAEAGAFYKRSSAADWIVHPHLQSLEGFLDYSAHLQIQIRGLPHVDSMSDYGACPIFSRSDGFTPDDCIKACTALDTRNYYRYLYSKKAVCMLPQSISKLASIRMHCDNLKIGLESVIYIGDGGPCDVDVLKNVGYPACPQNATDTVKRIVHERGGCVASSSGSQGVMEILEEVYM